MRKILLSTILLCCSARAQTACPAVQFQGSVNATTALKGGPLVITRQPNGSYTAYEEYPEGPYVVIGTIPNYASTLDSCIPARGSGPAAAPSTANFGNPLGMGSSPEAFAVLPNGDYLQVSVGSDGINVVEFSPTMQFVSENVYTVPSTLLVSVLITDLNGDGNPDLVAVISGVAKGIMNGSLAVLLGTGGTNFVTPQIYPISASDAATVAAGDFNGDGKIDLAATSFGFSFSGGHVSIFLGNGDGTFQPEEIQFPGALANGIATADLNGDGKLDLVYTTTGHTAPTAVIALGNGDGTFGTSTSYPIAGAPVTIADANNDGLPDIIAGGSILFGDGKGNFPTRRDYTNGGPLLFDLDGDGIPDLVNAYGNPFIFAGAPTSILVAFGEGSGKFFDQPAAGATGNPAVAFASADFNRDGIPDLATADNAGNFAVLLGEGDGSFSNGYSFSAATLSETPVAIVSGDFNNDGNPDFIALMNGSTFGPQTYFIVFLGDGKGNFTETNVTTPGRFAESIAVADLNDDGNLDLAIGTNFANQGTFDILLGDGHGNFNTKSGYNAGVSPVSMVVGDFNGDGKPDLAILNQAPGSSPPPATLLMFLGNGDGTLAALAPITLAASATNLAAADFNRDGKLDLAVSSSAGPLVFLGNGDGTFSSQRPNPGAFSYLVVADLNGDSIPDIVGSGGANSPDPVAYLLGNGDGTFQPQSFIPTGTFGLNALLAADFNRDGKIDIAGLGGPLDVSILLNTTTTPPFTLVSSATFAAGAAAPDSLVTAFGKNFAAGSATAQSISLPTSLAGTNVTVAGLAAPLLYVSPTQINFEMPSGIPVGPLGTPLTIDVVITSSNGSTQTAPILIAPIAPAIFTENGIPAADVVSITGGVQTWIAVSAAPISLAPDSVYLILYGTGIRGAGANVTANIQGSPAQVTYAGPQPDFPGLDQVNILMPKSLAGAGFVNIVLAAAGIGTNTVKVSIQ